MSDSPWQDNDPGPSEGDKRTDEEPEAAELPQGPPATDMTIEMADHEMDVEVDAPDADDKITEVDDISDADIDRLRRILAEDSARRGQRHPARPFENADIESLLLLQNQVRSEIASR